jgi:hypothetical protein
MTRCCGESIEQGVAACIRGKLGKGGHQLGVGLEKVKQRHVRCDDNGLRVNRHGLAPEAEEITCKVSVEFRRKVNPMGLAVTAKDHQVHTKGGALAFTRRQSKFGVQSVLPKSLLFRITGVVWCGVVWCGVVWAVTQASRVCLMESIRTG